MAVKLKNLLCIALAMVCLASCGRVAEVPEEEAAGGPAVGDELKYELTLAAEFLDLPAGMDYAEAHCRVGDTVWLGGGSLIGSVSLDGRAGGLVGLPEGCDQIYAMCAHGENVMALVSGAPEYAGGGQGEGSEGVEGQLWLLEFDGAEFVSSTELERLYSDSFRSMIEIDGRFYLLSFDRLIKLSSDGSEAARFEHGDSDVMMISMRFFDGELVVLAWDFDSFGAKLYRLDAGTLSPAAEAAAYADMFSGIGVAGGALVVDKGSGVYALDGDFQLGEALFEWDELFVSGEYQEIYELDDGYLFFDPNLGRLCRARWKEARVRKTIVMATDASYGQAFTVASDFNRSQDEYFVQINVYEAYEDEGALMRLQAEIGAGKWPDVFAFNLPDTLAEMRDELTLENLYDYIDADPGLSRDELMEPVLRALEKDGALYWLPWKFWMLTLVGPESLVGQAGISVEDTLRIADENELVPI